MTFSCKNFDFNTDSCSKLNTECVPGRSGCVLEGKVKFAENITARLEELEEERAERMKNRRR